MSSEFQRNLNIDYIEYKSWGFKYSVYNSSSFQVDICCIRKGGYSSIHHHDYRWNKFLILNGVLEIYIYPRQQLLDNISEPIRYVIGDKQKTRKFIIKPKVIHKFHALTDVKLLEVYNSVCSEKDIIRQDQGGIGYESLSESL